MEELSIGAAQKISSPNPFCLVTSLTPENVTNLAAISWWTYVSNKPATILVCLSNKGYSGECICNSGEFGLSIVGETLAAAAFRCGTSSGRNVNKAVDYRIPLFKGKFISPMLVEGSRLCYECKLVQQVAANDHTIYIGEVLNIFGDPSVNALFAFEGYGKLSIL